MITRTIFVCIVSALYLTASAQAENPIALNQLSAKPEWLSMTGAVRGRVQGLSNQFRPGFPDEYDTIFALRSLFHVRLQATQNITLGTEFQDSRIFGANDATPLNTALVNSAELLQAYVSLSGSDVLGLSGRHRVTLGRSTFGLGRGRLIGRNKFRNTINTFTGIRYQRALNDQTFDAFWVLPVDRRPKDRASLLENEAAIDRESFAQQLWAVHFEQRDLLFGLTGQIYLFGLHETDKPFRQTRNRQLFTPGFALLRASKPNDWFLDVEASANIGTSRATSAASDTETLDQFAYTTHIETGYQFDAPWKPLVILQFDVASGDRDPADGGFGQYDTLFGPKRADFGHTDIYGALGRENIIAPGLAVHVWPTALTHARLRYQPAWLYAARDGWPDIGVRDPEGQSGRFIGHQFETRFNWELADGAVQFGAGGAALLKGRFARTAPNANNIGDSLYFYSDITIRF